MSPEERAERLASLRTLGKALYENPATQYDAVDVLAEALALSGGAARDRVNLGLALLRAGREDEGIAALEKAQQQDPSLPHTWFNLGIAAKRAGDPERAVAQLERMAELVPKEPITRYNLGVLYKLQGRTAEALAAFERAAELDPYLAGARFQLAAAYRQAGRAEDARRANTEFRELKRLQADDAVGEDLEWSYYSELHDPLDARPAAVAPAAEPNFEAQEVATLPGGEAKAGGANTGLAVLDANGDRTPDLVAWNATGARLFLGGRKAAVSGLERTAGITVVAAGDFDDDGFPDLAVTTKEAAYLWHNRAAVGDGPRFVRHAPPLPEAAGRAYRDAVWLDFDQDYDLDLFLLGAESALLRNVGADDTGAIRFEDRSDAFPFVDGEAISGTVVDSVADGRGMDLAVAHADRAGTLYRDQLGARYAAEDLPALTAGSRGLTAFDLDDDGWTDLAARGPGGPLLLVNARLANARGPGFEALSPAAGLPAAAPFAFVDLENRGVGELVAGGRLARNRGQGEFAAATQLAALGSPLALASADFDADGRADLASLDAAGRLRLLLNHTETTNHWLRVDLVGKKNLQLAPGAEVEVRAGTLYQKRIYRGVPLTVGLGPHAEADAVRITWPNGLIQNETRQAAGVTASYEEAQRLSGSCPMVFTWNGRGMEFIGDVLGVAPLGAAAGDGVYFQVDHDEVLAIGGEQLVPRDGVYDVRMTEELREVGYVDHLRLLAVDHPAEVDVLHNDKFKGPPYPEFKLWGVEPSRRAAPTAAVDQNGDDVLPALLHRDRTYAAGVACNGSGISTPHTLTLDFAGAGAVAEAADVLVLHGWTDWADGSTFMATAQAPAGPALQLPVLRMRSESGDWETVVADPGVPAGKPKTIVVELPGWLSSSREIRIESSMCVYWDDVALAAAEREPTVRVTEMAPLRADLRFRGFSSVEVHPRRLQPEEFTYADLRTAAPWNPTPGVYTRFGDVRELLAAVDDRLIVFGAGDELALAFDAGEPPPLPDGWRRDFLLVVDGWAKDGDSNTAYGTAVEPLPHHGMAEYPYGPETPFPDGEAHRRWRDEYQTRRELRLTRSWAAPAADER